MKNLNDLYVPVKKTSEDGEEKTELELINPDDKQSDGSMYSTLKPLVEDHEHHLVMESPSVRQAFCDYPNCGFGGFIFPHNADLRADGHLYDLEGNKVI